MPPREKKHRAEIILTIAVLALLALLFAANLKVLREPLGKLFRKDIDFEGFTDEVEAGYTSDGFIPKNIFVNLNGMFARLAGQRTLNDVVKLDNDMLGEALPELDITPLADGIAGFSDYLGGRNIPFLYLQLPCKESLDGKSLPLGVNSHGNSNADRLLSRLSSARVETVDLRPLLSRTPEMLEQYFYKTDHHWNSDGAFAAFQELLNYLHGSFPESGIDLAYAQPEQWERHSLDDWFLGSWGKRVGIFFGGTDPLIWYTPSFETEMSCAIPKYGWLYRGDFGEANIRAEYIEEKDYFGASAYCVYIGGDYPLVQHRNLGAPSPLKVLLIKDSFSLPLEAYLSTVFREIDVIDPRQWIFSECSVAEYAERTEPDLVILAMNPSVFENTEYQNFGEETVISSKGPYTLVTRRNIALEAGEDNECFEACPLESGTTYRLTFEGVDILAGETEGVGLRLFDGTTNTILELMTFDLSYCDAANEFRWIFRTPDTQDEIALLFYAGIYGSTAGNNVVYRNVTLEKTTR